MRNLLSIFLLLPIVFLSGCAGVQIAIGAYQAVNIAYGATQAAISHTKSEDNQSQPNDNAEQKPEEGMNEAGKD
jgi:uncharacterized protein YceK